MIVKNIVFVFIGFMFVFFSCKQDDKEFTYYDSGEVKTIKHFRDDGYSKVSFFKNGTLKDSLTYNANGELHGEIVKYFKNGDAEKLNYKNGKKEGIRWRYKKNLDLEIIQYYENDDLEGVQRQIVAGKDTVAEFFRISDKTILGCDISEVQPSEKVITREITKTGTRTDTIIAKSYLKLYTYFIESPDDERGRIPIGSLQYSEGAINAEQSSYCKINIPDTVSSGEKVPFRLEGYFGTIDDAKLYFELGKIDMSPLPQITTDDAKTFGSKKGNYVITGEIKSIDKGYNIVFGTFHLKRSGNVLATGIIYEDFWVK
jgi:hypothetical protein